MKEDFEAHAQEQLASLKRDMRKTMEDATVRAVHKVMAEFEAKSDERLMEDWGPGPHECHSLPARGAEQEPVECQYGKGGYACCEGGPCKADEQNNAPRPAQQQEPVAYMVKAHGMLQRLSRRADVADEIACQYRKEDPNADVHPLYTSPPAQRKPLTHEQRVDLLARFEPHKHEWHAPAILIDMVEAAHGIKERP